MSVSDVAARIQQLQGQFALLHAGSGIPRPTTSGGAASGTTTFATALSDVSAAAATDGVSAMPGAVPLTDLPTPTGTGGTGQAVVDEARKYLGVPYAWGGTNPKVGLDCSGLVQLVYSKFGVDLPRVSYQQATSGKPVGSLAEARPGDLLAFGSPVHHIAIYIGDGKMIEAPRPGLDVRVIDVYEKPSAIRRVLPDNAVAAARAVGTNGGQLTSEVPYAGLFAQAAARYGVPATLLAAVARQESAYNPQAVSPAGARGLMQLMPATARGLGVDPDVPAQAVDGAARLLRDLISEFDRVDLALAAYNAGPGAVHRYRGIPPYRETQQYVPAVLGYQRQLENA
jgi:peptidoglycan DL-endopeptidase CwlO